MSWILALALILLPCAPLGAADEATLVALRGRVVDAQTGEPIAKALVSIQDRKIQAVTDAGGRFVFSDVAPGEAELSVTTVGYGVEKRTVRAGPETGEIEVRLSQEALRRSEGISVTTSPFEALDPAAPAAHLLGGSELENLASVLVDDPLRSVQSLPGIVASDDFGATFAARGLGFSSVGLYVDGVLMKAPFHTIRDANDAFSLSLLNGDVVESLSLIAGGAPARYGDRTGSVLALKTRNGSSEEFFGRASLGATGVFATLEGPIGKAKRTSWLISARKSYLDYVLERIDEAGIVLGFYDATAKLTHHPSSTQTVSLGLLHGRSRWRSTETGLRPQDSHTADAGTNLATLQWRWLPSPRLWVETVAFFSRETGRNRSVDATDRFRSASRQWGLRADATRVVGHHRLETGIHFRGLSEDAAAQAFDGASGSYVSTESYDVRSAQTGAWVQDTWTAPGNRLTVTLGGRLDHFEATHESRVLPRASLAWPLTGRTRLLAAFGEYAQFPDFEPLFGRRGNPELRAERATHYLLGIEHGLGANTRLRVEAYDQELTGLLFAPQSEWRLEAGRIVPPDAGSSFRNALSGHSRGVEVLVQRRSANGLSGWLAYSFGHARWHDEEDGLRFDSDFDQRHTATLYGTYRISPTLNLSTKYRYGSGFPVAGFFEARPEGLFLSSERNRYRPEGYNHWDIRANKAFVFEDWKLTLYGEVINVLNRTHTRYNGLDGLDPRTGFVVLDSDTLFPFLPSVGVTVEF
jgi:hypothetical protein